MTCMSGEIEDEKHFMLVCNAYDQLRKSLFLDISIVTAGKWQLEKLSPELQWRVLMEGSQDKFQIAVAENVQLFVAKAMKRRGQS